MRSREAMNIALDALRTCLPHISGAVRASFSKAIANDSTNIGSGAKTETPSTSPALSAEEHGHTMRIMAAAQRHKLDEARQQMIGIHAAGYKVPGSCVIAFVRSVPESNQEGSLLKNLPAEILTADAVVAVAEYAAKNGNSKLIRVIHERAEEMDVLQLP